MHLGMFRLKIQINKTYAVVAAVCHAITYFITTDFIFNLNLTILLLIITLSLYRKRAKNMFTDSLDFKHSQKLPLKYLKLFTL